LPATLRCRQPSSAPAFSGKLWLGRRRLPRLRSGPIKTPITLETLFAGFGPLACLMIFVGVLKSLPGVAAAPINITPVLLGLLVLHLAFALVARRLVLPPAAPALFLLHAALSLLAIFGSAGSQGREIFPDKLRDLVLVAPFLMAVGVAVAADKVAYRRFLLTAKLLGPAIGIFIAAAFALGLVNVVVQFGGRGSVATQRVQYQLANLLIALAASAYAAAAMRTAGVTRAWNLGMTLLLAFAALIPGGRSGFIGLCLGVIAAPFLVLWHRGARRQALWLATFLVAALALAAAFLFASRELSAGLRTVERFTQGGIGESSARLPLWRAAFDLIGANDFWGVGLGGYTVSAGWGVNRDLYPHNLFIEAAVELGLPGLLLFLGIWITAILGWLSGMARSTGEQWATTLSFGLIILILISVSTDLGNPLMWFCLGLLAGTGGASSWRWPAPRHLSDQAPP
jgi:O-antigen ligase